MSDEDTAKVILHLCAALLYFFSFAFVGFYLSVFYLNFVVFVIVAAACSICDWDFKCTLGGLFCSSGYSRKIL
jgi:hypothetical protein